MLPTSSLKVGTDNEKVGVASVLHMRLQTGTFPMVDFDLSAY